MQLPIGPRFPDGLPIGHKSFLVRSLKLKQVGGGLPSFKCTTAYLRAIAGLLAI